MNNLFPPHKDVHETYDLKGSTVGREYPEDLAEKNPRATLKDLNWINRGKSLELGPEKRALLTEQLRRDSELLKELNVMDYSLLIGIHNMKRGNRDNVRSNTLKVFSVSMRCFVTSNTRLISSSVAKHAAQGQAKADRSAGHVTRSHCDAPSDARVCRSEEAGRS
jgi:1-phosphatidylinositol-4-phosphate 5-kinase